MQQALYKMLRFLGCESYQMEPSPRMNWRERQGVRRSLASALCVLLFRGASGRAADEAADDRRESLGRESSTELNEQVTESVRHPTSAPGRRSGHSNPYGQ
jgi:hypothetical protein